MTTSNLKAVKVRAMLASFSLLIALLLSTASFAQAAQESSSGQKSSIFFKMPKGYMSTDLLEHKTGKLLLDPKRAAGMFIVYLEENETTEAFIGRVKSLMEEMFYHKTDLKLTWTALSVPAHTTMSNETGTLYDSSNGNMEVQFAAYAFTLDNTKIVYGYFAMQHTDKRLSDDGRFLNSSGGGVKDFENFWKTIRPEK